jgi:heme a synthase
MTTNTIEIPAVGLDGSSGGSRSLTAFAWGVLAFNVAVILWGAYVRLTGSGAGCGNQWPLCAGVVSHPKIQTLIEFTHRMSSAAALVSVLCLWFWTRLKMPTKHPSRYAAAAALLLIVNEAFLGAFLVLFEHVAQDKSLAHTVSLSLHSMNTMLLLGAITLTAFWTGKPSSNLIQWPPANKTLTLSLILIVLLTGTTGAMAALADTLFPAASLGSSFLQDFSSQSHYLLRLRILHPVTAVIGTLLMAWLLASISRTGNKSLQRLALLASFIFLVQLVLGVFNILLLAPMWLQMTHLLTADLLWISLVLLTATSLFTQGSR